MNNLIEENVQKLGEKVAYVYYETESCKKVLTYNNILQTKCLEVSLSQIPKDVCIGLYMKNNPCVPIIIYNVLKLGVAFTFLDPENSKESLQTAKELSLYMIISCGLIKELESLPINKTKELKLLSGCELHIYFLQQDCWKAEYAKTCYVIQTSGTLGKKKNVRVSLECIASNIISFRKLFHLNEDDNVYFGTPFSFDPCIIELFLSLTSGCCLVSTSKQIRLNPNRLFNTLFLSEPAVTFLQMCPSVFQQFGEDSIEFLLKDSSLRILCLGGESFPESLLRNVWGKVRVFNLYGITEVSCWASAHEIKDVEGISLGEVLDETIFEVRDEDGKKVEEGEGVLFIGSNTRICLLDNENLSSIKLPIFRNSGDIVYVKDKIYKYKGRWNNIVKKFGTKINLYVLEQQISSSLNLPNKCIWDETAKKILAFIKINNLVPSKKPKILDKIRVKLIKDFSAEYFPDEIELVEDFPLTKNGKIDTNYLLSNVQSKMENSGNISETFSLLFSKYFGLSKDEVCARKDLSFSEFGGSSILKLQFVEEMLNLCRGWIDRQRLFLLLDMSFESAKVQLENVKKLSEDMDIKTEMGSKFFEVGWKKNLLACVDTKATIIQTRDLNYVAIGNFANLFTILNVTNGEEISSIFLGNSIENACLVSACKTQVFVGCFDGYIYCLEIKTCMIIWKFQTKDKIKNTPCLSTDQTEIIFGSYDKFLYSLDTKTGNLVWRLDLCEAITANPINILSKIYVGCIKGKIVCLGENDGKILWMYQAKHPIFNGGQNDKDLIIFCDVFGFFYAFDLKLGNLLWMFEPATNSNIFCSFLICDSEIVFGKQDKQVYILQFDKTKCILKLTCNLHHEISTKPTILHTENQTNYLILTSSQGLIFLCKYAQNFEIIDTFSLGNQSFSQPTICDNRIFIGCRDNYLYCININKQF